MRLLNSSKPSKSIKSISKKRKTDLTDKFTPLQVNKGSKKPPINVYLNCKYPEDCPTLKHLLTLNSDTQSLRKAHSSSFNHRESIVSN